MAAKKKQRSGFAVVADVHVANHARFGGREEDGLNARGRFTIEALREAVTIADLRGCEHFVVAGDLFDNRRPEPAVVAAVQHVFADARERGLVVVAVPGNHDLLDADASGGNTTCAPLWQVAQVPDHEGWWRIGGYPVLVVPFQSRAPMSQHLGEVLSAYGHKEPKEFDGEGKPSLLITHVGVYDLLSATPWQKRAKDAIEAGFLLGLIEDAGIETAFVGNYHDHHRWTDVENGVRRVFQVGALCPVSFSETGTVDRGLMAIYQNGGVSFVTVPGPRFLDIETPRQVADLSSMSDRLLERTFVRVSREVEIPLGLVSKLGGVDHVGPEVTEVAGAAGAASAVAGSDPAAELAAYVEQMNLPEDVERGAVAAFVADCWKKGA